MKSRPKELTSRSNGWGYAKRKHKLKEYIRGWVGYYHLANMKRLLLETDEWLRRRIRMWTRIAKKVGMKHHDGFCLWDTQTTDLKVTNAPFGKDILTLLRKSCDKYGIFSWGYRS